MLNVYLLRHGETSYNADGNRYCGRTDIGLTEKGLLQASVVYEQLRGLIFDGVYSSPLTRARLTAEIASGGKMVQTDDRLTEIDFGKWEGETKEEFISKDPGLWEAWMQSPANVQAGETGENAADVVKRADDFFREMLKKYPYGNILVVAHNGINRMYLAYKLGMYLKNYRKIVQENSAVTLFTLDESAEITLKLLNGKI